MATHSSSLMWRIPCTDEPGRLQSMVSQRVGHNRGDLALSKTLIGEKHLNFIFVCVWEPSQGDENHQGGLA